jgi:hypothetical protein
MSEKTTVEEGNFEHLFNFEAHLKIYQIFFTTFFSLKAKPKILRGVAKLFSMVLPLLVGLFLKKGRCSNITRMSANFERDSIFCI